ncbi:MAG TPA: urea ABC transporter permease subunit UrtB [Verrucomicrobiae bacterium]|nr:urea ABC transporter permease subunit UrtB [Verrucomicrobiae bacterium]
MKLPLVLALAVLLAGLTANPGTALAEADPVRKKLAEAILSEGGEQQQLLNELADTGSKAVVEILTAWSREGVFIFTSADNSKIPVILEEAEDSAGKRRALRIEDGQALRDSQGSELRFASSELAPADTDMRLRSVIQQALDTLALSMGAPDSRRSAALKLGNSQKIRYLPLLQNRLSKERNSEVRRGIEEAVALLELSGTDARTQIEAIRHLGQLRAIGCVDNLKSTIAKKGCAPEVIAAGKEAIRSIEDHIWWVNFFGTIFHGLSLGSVLLVVALGLAITFGLMGIINMAHGEMIAVGAYACYVVQNLFAAGFGFSVTLPFNFFGRPLHFGLHLPGINATGWFYETYFLFAIPMSFAAAALAGLFIERTVIRFLYRRPLESLLATWGISLAMQQCFRMVFGANNVQVNSPSWLLGHFTINDVSFGYNRVFVIGFAAVIVLATWLLLTKTSLGLLVRAVMQNRTMASCLGVRTARVNMLTFAFGSGLAGLAGAFLSQIGNVGPSLGQTYIVDSFMTVVLGGVGSIVGTVCSAVGIGTTDQVLQQTTGSPVTGKIIVLVAIILFLQWKPGGLFSIRSRSLD